MNKTIKKGITQTFIQDDDHNYNDINKSSIHAKYDGNIANISVDLNDNGDKKHYNIQLDNDDLSNILNIKSIDTDLDKRLNDYKKRNINNRNNIDTPYIVEFESNKAPIYERNTKPLPLPLIISSKKFTRNTRNTRNKRYKYSNGHRYYKKPKTRKLYR